MDVIHGSEPRLEGPREPVARFGQVALARQGPPGHAAPEPDEHAAGPRPLADALNRQRRATNRDQPSCGGKLFRSAIPTPTIPDAGRQAMSGQIYPMSGQIYRASEEAVLRHAGATCKFRVTSRSAGADLNSYTRRQWFNSNHINRCLECGVDSATRLENRRNSADVCLDVRARP
jgi:hypothetical protein